MTVICCTGGESSMSNFSVEACSSSVVICDAPSLGMESCLFVVLGSLYVFHAKKNAAADSALNITPIATIKCL